MPEKVTPGPVADDVSIREAVCIHTKKIFDSCREEDIAPLRLNILLLTCIFSQNMQVMAQEFFTILIAQSVQCLSAAMIMVATSSRVAKL